MKAINKFFMNTATGLAKLSKCVSFQVGAVIVRDERIISMGYNGSPKGYLNCCDKFNKENFNRKDHHKWSNIYEIHAELNAILFAAKNGISLDGCVMYVTFKPCDQCIKNIIQSGIKKVIYLNEYDKCSLNNDLISETNITIEKF